MSIYDIPIQCLEPIIEHWFDKKELKKHLLDPCSGLCHNITYVYGHNDSLLYPCIREYLKYTNSNFHVWFPIEGDGTEYLESSDNGTLYDNPKRLHLAVYMLAWLRQHNV